MEPNYEALKFFLTLGNIVLTAGVGFYVHLSNRHRVTNERISKLEEKIDSRLDDHESRLTRNEERVSHLPGVDAVQQVRELVTRVGGDVRGLQAEVAGLRELVKPMQNTIQLVNEYLLNHKS